MGWSSHLDWNLPSRSKLYEALVTNWLWMQFQRRVKAAVEFKLRLYSISVSWRIAFESIPSQFHAHVSFSKVLSSLDFELVWKCVCETRFSEVMSFWCSSIATRKDAYEHLEKVNLRKAAFRRGSIRISYLLLSICCSLGKPSSASITWGTILFDSISAHHSRMWPVPMVGCRANNSFIHCSLLRMLHCWSVSPTRLNRTWKSAVFLGTDWRNDFECWTR